MPRNVLTRRQAMLGSAGLALSGLAARRSDEPRLRLATFAADVTCPIGHPLMGGGIAPAIEVVDPLELRGIVLTGPAIGEPVVMAAIDWCEVRNDAYSAWRDALAEAAGTSAERVCFASVHQHDTPISDLEAERLLESHECAGRICDLDFHAKAVACGAAALKAALPGARPVTRIGAGQVKVGQVASNRRFLLADGSPSFARMSATRDAYAREQEAGTIDPWLKTIGFWDGDAPIAALHHYATHPMSYYGQGGVSADFVGMARRRFAADHPGVFPIYFSGCSGNVVAGKFNDGSPENRQVLADRIAAGMAEAWAKAEPGPLPASIGFRSVPLRLEPRDDPGFTVDDLTQRLKTAERPFDQCLAALGLSWRKRADAGAVLDVPALDLGPARWLLLPGESYVEYQILAQKFRPDALVCVAGYGESATGYIPTERHWEEGDTNLDDWCWVARGSESRMAESIAAAVR